MRYLLVVSMLFIAQLSAEVQSPMSEFSFKEAVSVMKNFCASPKAINNGSSYEVSCAECPKESGGSDNVFEFRNAIRGNFSGAGDEILVDSSSCSYNQMGSNHHLTESTVLLNPMTSNYVYLGESIIMSQCLRYSMKNKDFLVCHKKHFWDSMGSEGEVSQYVFNKNKWEKNILLKTASTSGTFGSKALEISIIDIKKEIDHGILSKQDKLIVNIEIYEDEKVNQHKLVYSLNDGMFKIDNDSKEIKLMILEKVTSIE